MNITRGHLGRLAVVLSTLGFSSAVGLPATAANLPQGMLLLTANVSGHTVLAAGADGVVLRSTNDGADWHRARTPTAATLTRLTRGGGNAGIVFAVGFDGTILRSADDGETWQGLAEDARADNPYFGLVAAPDGHALAVGGFGRAYASTDFGAHWQAASLPDNEDGNHLNDLIASGHSWLLVGEGAFSMLSHDEGRTWQKISMPVQGSLFGVIARNPGEFIAFGLRGHVVVSTDDAASWQSVDSGLTSELLGATVLHNDTIMLVGTRGGVVLLDPALQHARAMPYVGHGSYADVVQTASGRILAVGDAGMTELPQPEAVP